MQRRAGTAILTFIVSVFVSGCGGSGLHEVNGTVTLKGKSLPIGRIEFQASSASASATISDGKYRLPAEKGLPPGKYKVLITSVGAAPQAKDVPPGSGPMEDLKEPIPEIYNLKSTLSYEVIAGTNTANFDLK